VAGTDQRQPQGRPSGRPFIFEIRFLSSEINFKNEINRLLRDIFDAVGVACSNGFCGNCPYWEISMAEGKRLRSPQVATLFAAAQKNGLRVTGATIKNGRVELKFAPGDGTTEPPADDNEWDREYGEARTEVR
jgi:hypothetical protein